MRSYTHSFTCAGQSWTCTFNVSLADTFMTWSPKCPSEKIQIWREYRRWRDRCLRKFGQRTGVYHEIRVDIPQAGVRDRITYTVTREAAYAFARASVDELANAKVVPAQRQTRDRMLRELGAVMLLNAQECMMQ